MTQHPPMHQFDETCCGFRWLDEALFLERNSNFLIAFFFFSRTHKFLFIFLLVVFVLFMIALLHSFILIAFSSFSSYPLHLLFLFFIPSLSPCSSSSLFSYYFILYFGSFDFKQDHNATCMQTCLEQQDLLQKCTKVWDLLK